MRLILATILAMGVCGQAWAWDDEDAYLSAMMDRQREAEKLREQLESQEMTRQLYENQRLWNERESLDNQKKMLKIEKERLELEKERAQREMWRDR